MRKDAYLLEIEGVSELIYELSEASGRDTYEILTDIKGRLEEFKQRDSDIDYIIGICEDCNDFKKCVYKDRENTCPYIIKTIDEYKS